MSIPKRTVRGVRNIRTHMGRRTEQVADPYQTFLRISMLEMEKARRGKERESAMFRVGEIDARFREIETEKAELLAVMDKKGGLRSDDNASGVESKPAKHHGTKGFKIRY